MTSEQQTKFKKDLRSTPRAAPQVPIVISNLPSNKRQARLGLTEAEPHLSGQICKLVKSRGGNFQHCMDAIPAIAEQGECHPYETQSKRRKDNPFRPKLPAKAKTFGEDRGLR